MNVGVRLCSKFFGAKGAAPQQQTKLSFATKAKVAEHEDERDTEDDASAKENTDPDQGTRGLRGDAVQVVLTC
jgi:hypothetical protein